MQLVRAEQRHSPSNANAFLVRGKFDSEVRNDSAAAKQARRNFVSNVMVICPRKWNEKNVWEGKRYLVFHVCECFRFWPGCVDMSRDMHDDVMLILPLKSRLYKYGDIELNLTSKMLADILKSSFLIPILCRNLSVARL